LKNEINNFNEKIKSLKNINQIEKYAREKYYMKKENEDVYIIEFEGDSAKSKPSD
jgi:cell division protein FtsB